MLIGVSGKAGSGKGEFANIAVEEFGAVVVSFATGVKEEVEEFLRDSEVDFERRHLYGTQADKEKTFSIIHGNYPPFFNSFLSSFGSYSASKWYFTARSLLQWWGTEYRRAQDANYWVKRAMAKCSPDGIYVIDDCRFPNEAKAIQFTGGKLVRINRPAAPTISNSTHPSEIALDAWDKWDYVINNSGTLRHFRNDVRNIVKEITCQETPR